MFGQRIQYIDIIKQTHTPAKNKVKMAIPPEKDADAVRQTTEAVQELLAKDREKNLADAQKAVKSILARAKTDQPEDVYHTIKFMEDVPLTLHAEVARTQLPLRDILKWKDGSIVPMDKIVGEPIELLIGDRLIARGEVVVVNDRFGIRISEITRSDENVGDARQ